MNINDLKKDICEGIRDKLVSCGADVGQLDSDALLQMLEYPPDAKMGDIAFPCFKLSKTLRRSPAQIASMLSDGLTLPYVAKTEVAGGYLNFFIADSFFTGPLLDEIIEKDGRYGSSDEGAGKTVVIDYSSPNIAKPFHIGHLGSTVIGHSLKLLHQFAGYKCVGINHLGDWGTQCGKLIVAYRKWGDKERIEEKGVDEVVALYVRFHKEAETDPSLNDLARAEFTKLEQHDEENTKIWKWLIGIGVSEYKKTYAQLGIEFDSYCGESFYSDKMDEQVQIMRDKGLLKVDNGASIVDLSAYNMPPCLILKSDGSTLYPTRDIAAAVYRKRTYNFDKCMIVTSSAQSLHFAQWFKVCELMGYEWASQLVHVPYGTVSINGEKLATRTGNVVLLKDLFAAAIDKVGEIMDEKNPGLENKAEVAQAVGVGAIVFHYLYNSRIKDINFVIEDALSFDGATGPYAQYTYARTASILAKSGVSQELIDGAATPENVCREEIDLLRVLSYFPERIDEALAGYEPSVITRYIIECCTVFNRFYQACPIITAPDEATKLFRLRITKALGRTLKTALSLICLKAPEKI